MYTVSTPFSPALHGFHFRNRFDLLTPVHLPGGALFDPGEMIIGLCGGMCYLALDYYLAGKRPPSMHDADALPPRLLQALQRRQRESNSLAVLRKLFSWIMKPDGDVSRLTAWREFPRLRQRLDSGQPAVLLLVHTRGLQNPTLNHQVLALGYAYDPLSRQAEVHIYDPNLPGQANTLTVNLATASRDWDLRDYHGEPLRGFFLQAYRRQAPPELD